MILKKIPLTLLAILSMSISMACTSHQIDLKPVEVKPIHIIIDVNVKIDKALDDFFGELDK